jgi:hypothetical protein
MAEQDKTCKTKPWIHTYFVAPFRYKMQTRFGSLEKVWVTGGSAILVCFQYIVVHSHVAALAYRVDHAVQNCQHGLLQKHTRTITGHTKKLPHIDTTQACKVKVREE